MQYLRRDKKKMGGKKKKHKNNNQGAESFSKPTGNRAAALPHEV